MTWHERYASIACFEVVVMETNGVGTWQALYPAKQGGIQENILWSLDRLYILKNEKICKALTHELKLYML